MNIRNKNGQRGAALVEFTLVIPLLLLLIFGIIEFSILFYEKAVITNASREAAREWAIHRTVKLTEAQILAVVTDYTQDRMISFSSSTTLPTIVPEPYDPDGNLVGLTAVTHGFDLSLTVTYDYDFLLLPGFMGNLLPKVNLSATTVMRAE